LESRSRLFENVLQTIGNTPLIRLNRVARGVKPALLAKVEFFNPGGSVKDRIGVHMIEQAEKAGLLKPGATIVESTSGNTGVGLAIAAAVKGYKAIFTMPDKMSREKIDLLKSYGARVVITPTAVSPDSPESFYSVARRIVRETPNAFLANQYFNPDNPEIHYRSTAPEIWEQTGGRIDVFVAGMGTGGTISGVGRYLKEKNPAIRVIGSDPVGSILREQFETGQHEPGHTYLVEGIGEDMVPGTLDFSVIDEILNVTDQESFRMTRRLSREEGLLCGGSSGTALAGALRVAAGMREDQVVVVLFADTGERYLSKVHNDEWMRDNRMLEPEFVRAGDVVRSKNAALPALISVRTSDTMREALRLIRAQNISQIPVLDEEGDVRGTIHEGELMSALIEGRLHLDDLASTRMQPALGIVASDASVAEVARLLADRNPAVLVQEGVRIVGILTRFDLIEYVAK
jgi:cystathionine beta-synthase